MNVRLVWHRLSALLLSLMAGGVLTFSAIPSVVWAQEASAGSSSDEARYQANLRRWQSMTEEERQVIRNKAIVMSEAERAALKEKAEEYRAMPNQDREKLRENFRKFRELPPERREALEQGSRGFRQLPPEKRDEIRRRYQEQRKEPQERRPPQSDQIGQGQGRKGQMRRDNGCGSADKPCVKNAPLENPRNDGQVKPDRPQPRRAPPSARGPQNRRK